MLAKIENTESDGASAGAAPRWSDLPAGSFSSVGTNCNTVVLRLLNDGRSRFY